MFWPFAYDLLASYLPALTSGYGYGGYGGYGSAAYASNRYRHASRTYARSDTGALPSPDQQAQMCGQDTRDVVGFPRPQPAAEVIPIYNGRGCTLLELGQGKCSWPIGKPGAEDFCFFGNEPVEGLPYCLGHARIAYRSVGRQRSSAGA
jgi:hypothetical protein